MKQCYYAAIGPPASPTTICAPLTNCLGTIHCIKTTRPCHTCSGWRLCASGSSRWHIDINVQVETRANRGTFTSGLCASDTHLEVHFRPDRVNNQAMGVCWRVVGALIQSWQLHRNNSNIKCMDLSHKLICYLPVKWCGRNVNNLQL